MLSFRTFLQESATWATINAYGSRVFATLLPEQQRILLNYASTSFYDINTFLHQFSSTGAPLTPTAQAWLDDTLARYASDQRKHYTPASFTRMQMGAQKALDACFTHYALPQAVEVMRRVPVTRLFPHGKLSDAAIRAQPNLEAVGSLILRTLRQQGSKIQFPQYLSTSMHEVGPEFGSSLSVVLFLHLPAGTPAIPIPNIYNQAVVESEIVLPRKTTVVFPESKNRRVALHPTEDVIHLYGIVQ